MRYLKHGSGHAFANKRLHGNGPSAIDRATTHPDESP